MAVRSVAPLSSPPHECLGSASGAGSETSRPSIAAYVLQWQADRFNSRQDAAIGLSRRPRPQRPGTFTRTKGKRGLASLLALDRVDIDRPQAAEPQHVHGEPPADAVAV